MTLEAAIKENTEVTRELIEVLTRTSLPEAQATAKPAPKAAALAKPKAAPASAEEDELGDIPAHVAKGAAKPVAAAKPAPKAAPAKTDDGIDPAYAPVKAAILDAIAKNFRPQIAALFKKYGAKNGQELDPTTYDEVLGEIDGIVNGEMA